MSWAVRESMQDHMVDNLHATGETGTKDRSKPERFTEGEAHLYQVFSGEEWDRYPFASEDDLKWFREAKYGLFFHVGLSALEKVDIGWSRYTHKLPDTGNGPIPDEVYDGWAQKLKMEEFNAREWISLAQKGGMKYVVIIVKHHDGFHMWDTQYSRHKITNTPFGRDYLKELAEACREIGMKIGLYYSQRDWYHPDYEPITRETFEECSCQPPYRKVPGQKLVMTPRHKRYIEYMHNAVMELMTGYGKIDLFWWDSSYWGGMFEEEMWETFRLEEQMRKAQPHILINNRGGVPGDFDTPECMLGRFQSRMWESCMPLGTGWAWTGQIVKTKKDVIFDLVNCVCRGGNLLVSIGAMPNGQIDAPETQLICDVGEWISKYGESLYGTRGGPYMPCDQFMSTHTDEAIYLHILDETVNTVVIEKPDRKVRSVKAITGEALSVKEEDGKYQIVIDGHNGLDVIIKMELE